MINRVSKQQIQRRPTPAPAPYAMLRGCCATDSGSAAHESGTFCQKCAIIEKKSRPPLPQNHTVQLKYWLKEYAMKISERQEEL